MTSHIRSLREQPLRGPKIYQVLPVRRMSSGQHQDDPKYSLNSSESESTHNFMRDLLGIPSGPFARSWSIGRHILSSNGRTGRGHVWEKWGTPDDELEMKKTSWMQAELYAELRSRGMELEPSNSWLDEPVIQDVGGVFEVPMDRQELHKFVPLFAYLSASSG